MSEIENIRTISILHIDDNPRAVESEINQVRRYIEEKGFKLIITPDLGKNFISLLKDNHIDIVLTDYNLSQNIDGLKIIQEIQKKKIWVDILFYTATSIRDSIRNKLVTYQFTEISENKNISEPLKRMIDKNIRRWEDISYLRGIVISVTIDLEINLNKFIADYFEIKKKKINDFHDFILENSSSQFEIKIKAMEKIIKQESFSKIICQKLKEKNPKKSDKNIMDDYIGRLRADLRYVQQTRNKLAHCKPHPKLKQSLKHMGDDILIDKKIIHEIFDKLKSIDKTICELNDFKITLNKKTKSDF